MADCVYEPIDTIYPPAHPMPWIDNILVYVSELPEEGNPSKIYIDIVPNDNGGLTEYIYNGEWIPVGEIPSGE